MHAFEARRIDKDLEHRLGLGQARHLPRIELEREEAPSAAGGVAPPEVRSRGGLDEREIVAQHAILGEVLDALERGLDRAELLCGAHADARAFGRVETQLEERHQRPR